MSNITKAILKINPNAVVSVSNNDIDTIQWHDGTTPISKADIEAKPYDSWTLDETTCLWEAPVSKPILTQEQLDNNSRYIWNETTKNWDLNE